MSGHNTNPHSPHQHQQDIFPAGTMETARNAAASSSPTLCECGDDHRKARSRRCPLFEITNCLNKTIEEFLDVQELLEFGKKGPMAIWLKRAVLSKLNQAWTTFKECQNIVERHPEWSLTGEICRLRNYLDEVATGCGHDNIMLNFRSVILALPGGPAFEVESKSLQDARKWAFQCSLDCDRVIGQYARGGALPVSCTRDPEGYVATVDKTFKRAVEAIILVPDIENRTVQELMSASYEIWAESRRLLCVFKRSERTPSP